MPKGRPKKAAIPFDSYALVKGYYVDDERSLKSIADEFGCTVREVKMCLLEQDVQTRPRGRVKGYNKEVAKEEEVKVEDKPEEEEYISYLSTPLSNFSPS